MTTAIHMSAKYEINLSNTVKVKLACLWICFSRFVLNMSNVSYD